MATRDLPKDWHIRRARVMAKHNGLCQIQGPRCKVVAKEVDHIVPRSAGGSHEDWNLRPVCLPCHYGRKGGPSPSRVW